MLKSLLIKSFILIQDLLYTYKLKFQYRRWIKQKTKNKPKKLNKTQIAEIKEYYAKYGFKVKTIWHEFYFSINNIYSKEYIPGDIFHAIINKKLNQMRQWPTLLDKNLLGNLFKDYKQPDVVLKNINGFFYVEDEIITEYLAVKRVLNQKCQMIIKPSIDSGNGQNVLVFAVHDELTSYYNLSVKELFKKYKKDFIVQFLVNQHESLKLLNPTSLNTLRIVSYLNGDGVHVLSTLIRIGSKDSFTDNVSTGGMFSGVDNNGILREYGYFENGTKTTKTDTGVLLKNFKIPSYDIALKQIEKLHLLIPYFRLVSWDIAIDNTETPVVIEYNTYHQGIWGHEVANGPLFGKFSHEILNLSAN